MNNHLANLGILLYDNVQPMDFIGPWEVFSFWKNVLQAPINMYLIAEKDAYIHCSDEIFIKAHRTFNDVPQLDYLLVPGGAGRLVQVKNENIISFIKKQAQSCQYVLAVCTGMFLLQKAGLLTGKSATTYWRAIPELQTFSDVDVIEERIVKYGNIWSSGGISSGIDLALAFIEEIAGKEVAGQVQLLFEYFPKHTLYANEKTVETLPSYHGNGNYTPYLPRYIKDYLAIKVKKED